MAAFIKLGGRLLQEDGSGILIEEGGNDYLLWSADSQVVLFGDKDFKPLLGFVEKIQWQTDIIQTLEKEQRIALRTAPRTVYECSAYMNEEVYRQVKSVFRTMRDSSFIFPLWLDVTPANPVVSSDTVINFDTTSAQFRAGEFIGLLTEDDGLEVKEISTMDSTSVTLTDEVGYDITNLRVVPMIRVTAPEGVTIKRGALNHNFMSIRLVSVKDYDLSVAGSFVQYKNLDVLFGCQPLLSGIEESLSNELDVFDNGAGKLEYDTKILYPARRLTCNFLKLTKVERHNLRKFLHKMKGRRGAFWLPSFHNDIVLNADISSGTNYMDVLSFAYGTYIEDGISDIVIEMTNGTRYFNRIISSNRNDVVERFIVENNWAANINRNNVDRIMFLYKVRFDSDTAEFKYVARQIVQLSMNVIEVPDEL